MKIQRKSVVEIEKKIAKLVKKAQSGAIYEEPFYDEEMTSPEIVGYTARGHRIFRRIERLYDVLAIIELGED